MKYNECYANKKFVAFIAASHLCFCMQVTGVLNEYFGTIYYFCSFKKNFLNDYGIVESSISLSGHLDTVHVNL